MATLAAHDQENVVRARQTGPAGKPLSAALKSFGSKTPANKAPKTPFKVPLNDENAVAKAGKSVLQTKAKASENLLMTTKKSGKLDENAFITPAAQRLRAPLGMKTTNAKGKAFQTPAPLSSAKTQKPSPRMRRPKVKIHQPEPQSASEDDVPEVEYMPPKEIPLPDGMDGYLPADMRFPMFEGANMTRGIWETYHNPIEDDGRTRMQREFDEGLERDRKKRDDEFDRVFEEQQAQDDAEMRRYFGIEETKKEAPKVNINPTAPKRTASALSTMRARSAVAALSSSSKPSYAAPTAATKSRLPSSNVMSKKSAKPLERSASRQAAAVAASKSTIGYAQGRAARAGPAVRKPLSNVTKPAPFSATIRRPATASSMHNRSASAAATIGRSHVPASRSVSASSDATLVAPLMREEEHFRTAEDVEREMRMLFLQDEEDEDVDAWMNNFSSQLQGDSIGEDLEDFQLQLPEGF